MAFNLNNCPITVHNYNQPYPISSSSESSSIGQNNNNNNNNSDVKSTKSMEIDTKQVENQSSSQIRDNNSNNDGNNSNNHKIQPNKRKFVMNNLESFGFKRKQVDQTKFDVIEANWKLENTEIQTVSVKSNEKSSNSSLICANGDGFGENPNPNSVISFNNNEITIRAAGRRFDWLRFPHLLKLIHETVIKHKFSFRKAADYCNFNYISLFLDNPICPSTIQGWYEPNPALKAASKADFNCNFTEIPRFALKSSVINCLQRQETTLARPDTGRPRILAAHLHLETAICQMIASQRKHGTPINSIIAQNLILGLLRARKFEKLVEFGGEFKCSRRWVRRFLQEYCWLTYRRSTNAAQKLPTNAEEQCEWMVQRIAILAEKYSIPPALLVNCDQTGLHYIPKSRYTYNPKGSQDVSVVGEEDKRQFTAVVAVSATNELLPVQCIYPGKHTSIKALPAIESRKPLEDIGFDFCQTKSHWSTLETTKLYIQNIIQPYFAKKIEELKLNIEEQHCILLVDVWHRDRDFLEFMKTEFPLIKLVFVPAGCTGIAQPCDVFVQRPFKHAILREFSNWAADSVAQALKNPNCTPDDVKLDVTAKSLRSLGCNWVLKAWNTVKSMEKTMKQGWIKCKILPRAFEQVYQLQSRIKWMENTYNPDQIHIPMGKNRAIPTNSDVIHVEAVTIAEQFDSHIHNGEDELEETEKVAKECTDDEAIAELMQADEDDQY